MCVSGNAANVTDGGKRSSRVSIEPRLAVSRGEPLSETIVGLTTAPGPKNAEIGKTLRSTCEPLAGLTQPSLPGATVIGWAETGTATAASTRPASAHLMRFLTILPPSV